jgi:hypothetical protein
MAEKPISLRKSMPMPQPNTPVPEMDLTAFNILSQGIATKLRDYENQIATLEIELGRSKDSREFARQDNARIAREASDFRAKHNELKLGIEVVVTGCIAACETTKEVFRHAEEISKQAFGHAAEVAVKQMNDVIAKASALLQAVRDSVDLDPEPTPLELPNEDAFQAELIGKTYGANNRKEGLT